MLNLADVRDAMRARLTATVLATTGLVTLVATTTGYTRSTGSFLTDGFRVGMPITPTGFTANPSDVIETVSALAITTKGTRTAQAAGASRALVATLPLNRAFDGELLVPVAGAWSLREEFVPATPQTITSAPNGGLTINQGLYFATFYAPDVYGNDALDAMTQRVLERFASGTQLDANGVVMWVPNVPGPAPGQTLASDTPGIKYKQLRLPWTAQSRAAVVP